MLVIVHAFQLLFIECDYPKVFVWWIGMHAVMFYFLFSKFYRKTYSPEQQAEQKRVSWYSKKIYIGQTGQKTDHENLAREVSTFFFHFAAC